MERQTNLIHTHRVSNSKLAPSVMHEPAQLLDNAGQLISAGRAVVQVESDFISFYPGDSASADQIVGARTLLVLNAGKRIPITAGRLSPPSSGVVHFLFDPRR